MRGHLLPLVSIASALVATMLAFAPLEYATGPFYDDIVARHDPDLDPEPVPSPTPTPITTPTPT